jgi:hypothetical protein
LLPASLRQRPQKAAVQGVQAVGRLDQDTTGLLLLTDDGQFIHKMSSPKHHVPKLYEVTTKHPITPDMVQKLLSGVVLDDDPKPVKAIMLGSGISQLKERGIIDDRLFKWSEELQGFRNLAAHPEDISISREDASDLQSFVYAIVEYIYDLADKYDEFKARTEARAAKEKSWG